MNDNKTKYANFIREFDELLNYSIAIIEAQAGFKVQNERENYGEKIFGKIVFHAMSLQKLLPSIDPVCDTEIWDISSQYALSRTILESFEAFSYITDNQITEKELECRVLAWKLHAEERRLKMLKLVGSKNPAILDVEKNTQELRDAVLDPRFSIYIPKNVRGKIKKHDCPSFLVQRSRRLLSGGVNEDYFNATLMHLSSHVHTHPFSLHQLFSFKAGTPEAYSLIKVGGQYACGFLSVSVRDMSKLFYPRIPEVPQKVSQTIDLWCTILEKGVK